MNRWKLVVPVVACMALPLVVGCAHEEPPPPAAPAAPEAPPAPIQVTVAPPQEQVEVVPAAPSTNVIWIKGHWHWNGANWNWVRGHYEAIRVGYRWVPAHYEARGGGWIYVPPHWAR